MRSVSDNKNIRLRSWLQFVLTVAGIIVIALFCSLFRIRLDLTEDKRYTLSAPTRKVLDGIRNDIYVQVYLDGELPIPLKRLRRSVKEMLDEFRIASGRKIDYEFINPADTRDAQQREALYKALFDKGLTVELQVNEDGGGKSRKMIFPGMIINYNGIELPVNFLKNNPSVSYDQNILHSMEGLEYEMIQTIATVSSDTIYKLAFLEGHGELPEIDVADITLHLAKFFTIDRGAINGQPGILDNYAAVIIANPLREFSEPDKLVLDQYIMNGGKVLWLVEEVAVNSDSLVSGETLGLHRPLNIEDQLFRYGARINPEMIQDMECMVIRMSVSIGSGQSRIVPAPWVYYPKLNPNQDHPITKSLNRVKGEFVNSLDTVGLDQAIRKTVLLTTSDNARTLPPPLMIRLKEAEEIPVEEQYNKSRLPVAVLLEGVFPSAFRNRMTDNLINDKDFKLKTESVETRMIVVADGDIIRNEVRRMGTTGTPYPLGQDRLTGELMGNRDFIINSMNYLVDYNGIMDLRSREMKLRLLDKPRIKNERTMWQLINIACPVLLVIFAGLIYGFFRRRAYAK